MVINDCSRVQRIAKELRKKIAIILQNQIKDPRISMTTVSGIEISNGLEYAKVFVVFLHNTLPEQIKIDLCILQDSAGFIRSLLGKSMYLRVIPKLFFVYDYSLIESARIYSLVNQVIPDTNR